MGTMNRRGNVRVLILVLGVVLIFGIILAGIGIHSSNLQEQVKNSAKFAMFARNVEQEVLFYIKQGKSKDFFMDFLQSRKFAFDYGFIKFKGLLMIMDVSKFIEVNGRYNLRLCEITNSDCKVEISYSFTP
jgi:hypothetical protein